MGFPLCTRKVCCGEVLLWSEEACRFNVGTQRPLRRNDDIHWIHGTESRIVRHRHMDLEFQRSSDGPGADDP